MQENLSLNSPHFTLQNTTKEKYRYSIQPDRYADIATGYRHTHMQEFSPYKHTYIAHRDNLPSYKYSPNIKEFSPYQNRFQEKEAQELDAFEAKQNALLDTLREAEYNTLQHTALYRSQECLIS